MSNFKAKMHQIRFQLWLRPRSRWGSLQRSSRPPSWIWGGLLLREGRGGKRERRGGEWRGEEAFLIMWPRRLSALNPPLTRAAAFSPCCSLSVINRGDPASTMLQTVNTRRNESMYKCRWGLGVEGSSNTTNLTEPIEACRTKCQKHASQDWGKMILWHQGDAHGHWLWWRCSEVKWRSTATTAIHGVLCIGGTPIIAVHLCPPNG